MEPHPLGPSVWRVLDCHGPWTNDTPEEQASGQREPRTNPQRKRAWGRAIRLLILTGACGSAAMLADPDNLPTLSAAQPYYVATITSVIHYCTGRLGIEENPAVLGTDCTVRSTLSCDVEGSKLAGGSYEDTMNASSRVPAKKEKKASCGFTRDGVDVWVVLHGRVFNVPNFLYQHLGGESAILTPAGKDATAEFDMIHPPVVVKKYAPGAVIGTLGGRRRGR